MTPTARIFGALALLALGACDGDGTGPSGRLTAEQVAGRYEVCELRFAPEGAQPAVDVLAAGVEAGSATLAVDGNQRYYELQFTRKGEFTDREIAGSYELGREEVTLQLTSTADVRDALLLPDRIRLGHQESPRRLAAAGETPYDVPRADYARLAGIPEAGLADRIPGRLHATFSVAPCG